MKKSLVALVLCAALVCGMATTGMALVPSASVETTPNVSAAASGDGSGFSSSNLGFTSVADADKLSEAEAVELREAYKEIVNASSVSGFLQGNGLTSAAAAALGEGSVDDLEFYSLFNVKATGKAAQALSGDGLVITFTVPAGKVAIVLNCHNGTWQVVPSSTTAEGKVTATFSRLSPVAILIGEGTLSSGEVISTGTSAGTSTGTSAGTSADGTVVSPETGDINFESVLFSGAILSAALLAYCLKRRVMA